MQDDEVTFNVFIVMKYPTSNEECFQVDIINKLMVVKFEEHTNLPLEA